MDAWVWLDGVESFEKGKWVRASKTWVASFPSVYLIEMIAQAGAILLGAENEFREDIVFTKIEHMEFSRPPREGLLQVEVEAASLRREGGWFAGKISQDGEKIIQGRVLLMNVGRLRPDGKGPITFPVHLTEAFQ